MSHQILPHLQCLRTTLATLSHALEKDPALSVPCAISGRLLDRMIVEQTTALQFQAESYAALLKILPAVEALVGAPSPTGNPALDAIRELTAICRSSDTAAYERFGLLSGDIQRSLLALGTAPALALAKTILLIETDYGQKLDKAVLALAATEAAASKAASNVRNTREIDRKALIDFIKQNYPLETDIGIKETNPVSGGYSKFTIGITLTNTKSLPENIILRGDASATFGGVSVVDEYRLIKTMYENGVSVPKPIALEQTGKVFGSPFLLVDKKPGIVIGHMFKLPTDPNLAISADVATQLAAIHRVPLAVIGNQIDGANGKNPCSSDKALAWIDEAVAAWEPLNMPSTVYETAFDWLRKNAAINDKAPRTLVHGDYGLNNLLIDNDKVSTILDWEFAHVGNPAYDLGYFYFQAKSLGPWEHFLEAYGKAGMPIPNEEQLNYNILLAATRLGVMVCQTTGSFTSGADSGLAGAAVIGGGFYEETIKNISFVLSRVM